MAPQIGQRARLNGKDVVWSGNHFGWQSPASYKSLENKGSLRIGSSAVRSFTQGLNQLLDKAPAVRNYFEGVTTNMAEHQKAKEAPLRNLLGIDTSKPNATQRAIEGISKATNINRSIVGATAAAAQMAVEGKAGLNSLKVLPAANTISNINRAQPGVRYGAGLGGGQGLPARASADDLRIIPSQVRRGNGRATRPDRMAVLQAKLEDISSQVGKDKPSFLSPSHIEIDTPLAPPLTGNWAHLLETRPDGSTIYPKDRRYSYAQIPPEFRRQHTHNGKTFVSPFYDVPALGLGSVAPPRKPNLATVFTPGVKPYDVNSTALKSLQGIGERIAITDYGVPHTYNPRRAAVFTSGDAPYGTPRPQRVFVEEKNLPKPLAIDDVSTSDLTRQRSDGNVYGNFEQVSALPDGWEKTGNFIVGNDKAYRISRDKLRQQFLEGKATTKDYSELREAVSWAENDIDKLNKILVGLGGTKQRYASVARRAIERKLGALENTYGGKPSLSKAEREHYSAIWDWNNLKGKDLPEAKRLSELATELFGNRGITPEQQARMARSSAAAQERIEGMLNFPQVDPNFKTPLPLDNQTRGGRLPSRSVQSPPELTKVGTDRAHDLTELKDAQIRESIKNRYQPKLSDEERARQRRLRANRPLRPIEERLKRNRR